MDDGVRTRYMVLSEVHRYTTQEGSRWMQVQKPTGHLGTLHTHLPPAGCAAAQLACQKGSSPVFLHAPELGTWMKSAALLPLSTATPRPSVSIPPGCDGLYSSLLQPFPPRLFIFWSQLQHVRRDFQACLFACVTVLRQQQRPRPRRLGKQSQPGPAVCSQGLQPASQPACLSA